MAVSNPLREKILKDGKMDYLVIHSGMRQRLEFVIVREKIGAGLVPFMKVARNVDAMELLRVAAEFDLPVMAPSGKFFAPGKKASDYIGV